jgi:hypothetical protein
MKKLLFLLLISQATFAQNDLAYGMKLGANYNTDSEVGKPFGFYGGGFLNIKVTDEFRIQPEVLYASYDAVRYFDDVRSEFSWGGTGYYQGDFIVHKKMVQVPVMAQYYFTPKFYGEIGPQPGYVMAGKLSFKDQGLLFDGETITTEMDSQFDFGFAFGMGYSLTSSVSVSARYYIGSIEKDNLLHLGIAFHLI